MPTGTLFKVFTAAAAKRRMFAVLSDRLADSPAALALLALSLFNADFKLSAVVLNLELRNDKRILKL